MFKYLVLIVVLFLIGNGAEAKQTYQIGFMVDNKSSETDVLLNQLTTEIKAVVGEDANIVFPENYLFVNNYQLSVAQSQYQQLIESDIDIIIAFGVITNEVVSKQKAHQKPTILFGAINQDYNDLDITSTTSGIKNFTYLIESESFAKDLSKLKQLTNFSNLGIVVDAGIIEFLHLKESFDQATEGLNTAFKIIPFQNVEDILNQLEGIDALYLAGGFFFKAG